MKRSQKQVYWWVAVSLLSIACLLLIKTPSVEAHPGRTDSSGGHTCRTNCSKWGLRFGQYHTHGGTTTPTPTPTPTPEPTPEPEPEPTPTPEPESNEESQPKPPIEETPAVAPEQSTTETQTNPIPQQNTLQEDEKTEENIEVDNDNENKSEQTKDKKEVNSQEPPSSDDQAEQDSGAGSWLVGFIIIVGVIAGLGVYIYRYEARNKKDSAINR